MKLKKLSLFPVILLSASISSCIVPNSPDPVGDSFKRTGDAIGKVVNGVADKVNPNRPQQIPQTHNYPAPVPYRGQQ